MSAGAECRHDMRPSSCIVQQRLTVGLRWPTKQLQSSKQVDVDSRMTSRQFVADIVVSRNANALSTQRSGMSDESIVCVTWTALGSRSTPSSQITRPILHCAPRKFWYWWPKINSQLSKKMAEVRLYRQDSCFIRTRKPLRNPIVALFFWAAYNWIVQNVANTYILILL